MPKRPLPPPVPPWPPFRIDPLPLHALFDARCPWCSLNRPGNALIQYIWPGDFLTRETMATPETSHAAAIDPLTPQPSRPTPSPRLRQRRVRLVLMKCCPAAPCRRRAARRRCCAACYLAAPCHRRAARCRRRAARRETAAAGVVRFARRGQHRYTF